MAETNDAELVAAARAGDRAALETLLDRYQDRIYRFGLRMCGVEADAEDVLQDTLLSVARHLDGFRGESSLTTWLYMIARRACARHRGRERSTAPTLANAAPLDERITDPAAGPAERAEARQRLEHVRQALSALTPAQREVFILHDAEGLTGPEVASVLGIEVGAVKARLHRARAALHTALAPSSPSTVAAGDCPDIVQMYSQHLEGDIDAQTCARMEDHLTQCPVCRNTCELIQQELRLCRSIADGPVPPEVQERVRGAVRSCLRPPIR